MNPLHCHTFLRALRIAAGQPSLLKSRRYIFLLSHQRAYTTLLTHILGSHSQISGYCETWTRYNTGFDLLRLRLLVAYHANYKPDGTYILDKILHSQIAISPAMLDRADINYVFVVRQPIPTVRSMVALHTRYKQEGRKLDETFNPATVEQALDHYRQRLSKLLEIGQELTLRGRKGCFVAAESLIDEPRRVLHGLQAFLRLEAPLCEHYSVFDRTGVWRHGDPSDHIWKRRIEASRPEHLEVDIPDSEMLRETNAVYQRCVDTLSSYFPLPSASPDIRGPNQGLARQSLQNVDAEA